MLLSVLLEESVVDVVLPVVVLEVLELVLSVMLSTMVEFMVFGLKSVLVADGSLFIIRLLAGGLSVVILASIMILDELCEVVLSTIEVLIEFVVLSMMVLLVGSTGILVVLLTIDVFWVVLEVLVRLVVMLVLVWVEVLLGRELLVTVLLVTGLFV